MLKDMKGRQNRNDRPPAYKNDKPRLHDMPYNTNWKYGKPEKPNQNKETPDTLKKGNHLVEDFPMV